MSDFKTRRKLIKTSLLSLGTLAVAPGVVRAAETCGLTPAQVEGPFYPVNDQIDKDADLTFVKNRNQKALGKEIILKGVVNDDNCKPVKNALVEIWQACASGKYNHPGDPNPAVLDPNFQYWGRALTNEKGEYEFKTVRPGHYQATNTWMRPAHIHFKVHRRGFEELTSQIYFEGDKYNAGDRILQALSKEEQKKLIVELRLMSPFQNPHTVGIFNISIRAIS